MRGGIFSTVALIFVVGAVVQVTTLTGAKGLLVLGALTMAAASPVLLYVALGISLPLLGGDRLTLGDAPGAIALLSAGASCAAIGFALLIARFARTPEQATTFSATAGFMPTEAWRSICPPMRIWTMPSQ